jgi:sulfur carrier protein ThiS adenylyltransferase
MKIGIAGIGGIGSNVARQLVQAGVKKIKIVDFDCVEASNLNRQFYRFSQVGERKTEALKKNLEDILPGLPSGVTIEKMDKKIQPGDAKNIFLDCAIVVEGFDDKDLKKMIIEELCTTGHRVVSASGIAGRDMESVGQKQMGLCHIVGDLTSGQDGHELFPPKIAMVASIMAGIVLNAIENENQNETKD